MVSNEKDDDVRLEDMDEFQEEGGIWRKVLVYGGSALGVLVILAVIFVMGIFLGRSLSDTGPAPVDSIKSQNEVLESLDTLKDSQVKALNEQFSELSDKSNSGDFNNDDKQLTAPKGAAKALDPFIDSFYSMPYNADSATKDQVADELDSQTDPMVAGGSSGSSGASPSQGAESLGQRVVAGDSPSKQLEAEGKKAGGPTLFVTDRADDDNYVLAGVVPFATNDSAHSTLFVAKVSNGDVLDFQFVGIVEGDVSAFDKARENMVTSDDEDQ